MDKEFLEPVERTHNVFWHVYELLWDEGIPVMENCKKIPYRNNDIAGQNENEPGTRW